MIRSEDGKTIQQLITDKCSGISLEQYLKRELQLTKAQIRSLKFRENGLRINGERSRVNYILRENDLLQIQLEEKERASDHLEETEGELEILYEDEDLIAVWKDAGIVVHPSHGHYKDTLSNQIYTYFKRQNKQVAVRSIGRLDRDTSGILVFAKNQVAAAKLWKQKEEGRFWKEYLALCQGKICEANLLAGRKAVPDDKYKTEDSSTKENENVWYTIHAPMDSMPGELMKMCVDSAGKEAVTHFQVIRYEESSNCTWIRVRIDTGRMHQIRVHMACVGHPLAGDLLYDSCCEGSNEHKKKNQKSSMYLCAWKAELYQPFTGEKITVSKTQHA